MRCKVDRKIKWTKDCQVVAPESGCGSLVAFREQMLKCKVR